MHHLFDASLSVVGQLSLSTDERLNESVRQGVVLGSRLSTLEHQFASFRGQSDLDFAIQHELNDWNENRASERFFVITGLPAAPAKLSGGMPYYCSLSLSVSV